MAAAQLLPLLLLAAAAAAGEPFDPDVDLNTPQTVRRHGYPAEAHSVLTADGYILTAHRIPHGRAGPLAATTAAPDTARTTFSFNITKAPITTVPTTTASTTTVPTTTVPTTTVPTTAPTSTTTAPPTPPPPPARGPPVLLQHGLLASSYEFVIAGPDRALAYLLADAGYDVWMGNARGNSYSRAHTSLPTDHSSPFWDFSFDEMAAYDLPAVIDYILNETGYRQLYYVGHSMGTTMFFAMAAQRREAAAKVAAMFALAPVALVSHMKSPVRLLAPFAHDFELLARLLGAGELLPQNKLMRLLSRLGCELVATERRICKDFIFVICGFDAPQFDPALLPLLLTHTPAGASTRTVVHYAQLIRAGKFQKYDYGKKGNIKAYNSTTPPEYDLTRIKVPVNMYYAQNDWLAAIADVDTLYAALHGKKSRYLVPLPTFNHLDFVLAKDVRSLVYKPLIHQLRGLPCLPTD